jgi:glutaredoxin
MKQQCYLAAIYLNWILLGSGVAYLAYRGFYAVAVAWVVFLPLAIWAYIRVFPSISQAMGYGKVDDRPAQHFEQAPARVTFYTALGCPFCPVVKGRLTSLREKMNFSLKEVDVTLRPGILVAKGIRAVPVIEVEGRRLDGNATSEQLADLISGAGH